MDVLVARATRVPFSSVISHSTNPTVRPCLTTRPTASKRAFQIGLKKLILSSSVVKDHLRQDSMNVSIRRPGRPYLDGIAVRDLPDIAPIGVHYPDLCDLSVIGAANRMSCEVTATLSIEVQVMVTVGSALRLTSFFDSTASDTTGDSGKKTKTPSQNGETDIFREVRPRLLIIGTTMSGRKTLTSPDRRVSRRTPNGLGNT